MITEARPHLRGRVWTARRLERCSLLNDLRPSIFDRIRVEPLQRIVLTNLAVPIQFLKWTAGT